MLGEHIYMEVMWGLIAVATAGKPPHRRDTNGEEVAILAVPQLQTRGISIQQRAVVRP